MRRAGGWLVAGGILIFGGLMVFFPKTFLPKTEPKGPDAGGSSPQREAASEDIGQDSLPPISYPAVEETEPPRPLSSGAPMRAVARDSDANVLVDRAIKLPKSEGRKIRELLRDALDLDPHNVRALRELAAARLEEEAYHDAIALAARCLAEVPGDADCSDIRNMAKGRSGRMDAREMEECYQSRPKDFGCVQGLTQLRIKQGRLDEARRLIGEMRAIMPQNALIPTMEGDVAKKEGDQSIAREKYQAACTQGQEYACNMAWQLRSGDR